MCHWDTESYSSLQYHTYIQATGGASQGPTLNDPSGAWGQPKPTGPPGWGTPSLDQNPHGPQLWFLGCSLDALQPSTSTHGVDQMPWGTVRFTSTGLSLGRPGFQRITWQAGHSGSLASYVFHRITWHWALWTVLTCWFVGTSCQI